MMLTYVTATQSLFNVCLFIKENLKIIKSQMHFSLTLFTNKNNSKTFDMVLLIWRKITKP